MKLKASLNYFKKRRNKVQLMEEECAIYALEKQIPKKPIKSDSQEIRYSLTYDCPTCGKKFTGTGIADFCYHCGQALDWSGGAE